MYADGTNYCVPHPQYSPNALAAEKCQIYKTAVCHLGERLMTCSLSVTSVAAPAVFERYAANTKLQRYTCSCAAVSSGCVQHQHRHIMQLGAVPLGHLTAS